MGTFKHCGLVLLLLILLTGCSRELEVYTVVGVNNDILTVTDGELTYNYDGELTSAKKEHTALIPIAEISTYGTSYSLKHIELNKYSGELKDAAGYYNYLLECGFRCTTLIYSNDYLDAKLNHIEGDEVRILYLGNSVVRIFYRNASNSNLFPPYINKEE